MSNMGQFGRLLEHGCWFVIFFCRESELVHRPRFSGREVREDKHHRPNAGQTQIERESEREKEEPNTTMTTFPSDFFRWRMWIADDAILGLLLLLLFRGVGLY